MSTESAKSIDKYEIVKVLNETAEGVIYRAVETPSNTKVLIKKYYPGLRWSDEVLDEFFNLVSYLRFIEHEFLLPVLDVGKHENLPYVVFADNGVTLLRSRQPGLADQNETLVFLRHTAEALDFLHKQEILHGILNPDNVALDADGYPQVFDFGLSGVFRKLLLENTDEGFENLSISDLKCTSPEQIQGRNPTRSSDIYAFGAVGYFYIFGDFPVNGLSIPETAATHLQPGTLRTVQIPHNVYKSHLQVIQKCMQLEPGARFESFAQLLTILERTLSGKRVRVSFKKRFNLVKGANRHPVTRNLLFSGFALLVVLAGAYYVSSGRSYGSISATAAPSASALPTSPQLPARTLTPVLNNAVTESVSPVTEAGAAPPIQAEVVYKPSIQEINPIIPRQIISSNNLADLREISRLGYGKPEEIAVSPDGIHFAFASSAGVFIFNQTDPVGWIDPQGWATSVQFSPEGTILAIGTAKGDIQLWDWQNDIKIATLSAHTDKINRIIFSQGDLMYSASADRDIIVWNWRTRQEIMPISAHARPINDIAVTSDGRTLFSCSDDGLIRVWDLASGRKLYELSAREKVFSGNIRAIALSSDDVYLAAGGDAGFLYQWKLVTTSAATSLIPQLRTDIVPVKTRIWSLQYIRDDQELLVGVDDGKTIAYNAAREKYPGVSLAFTIPAHPSDLVDVFGPSFDFASHSIFGGGRILSINWDGSVTNQQAQVGSPMFDNLDRLDFSPDGNILAAGGRRGSTHVWDLRTNQELYKNMYFLPFGDPIAPDGSAVAIIVPQVVRTSTTTGNLIVEGIYQIKNLRGSQAAMDLSEIVPNGIVGYARDGNVFISASYTQSKTWDFDSGYETFFKHTKYLGCAITSSANDDEKLQVISVSGVLPIWDTRAEILCPKSQRTEGSLSAFSNNLDLLVYINQNGLLEGFDNAQNKPVWQYHPDKPTTALAVSPDGSIVAAGNASGELIFLDGKTGRFLSQITGNYASVRAIEFSDDGKKVATAGADGIARTFGIVDGN